MLRTIIAKSALWSFREVNATAGKTNALNASERAHVQTRPTLRSMFAFERARTDSAMLGIEDERVGSNDLVLLAKWVI